MTGCGKTAEGGWHCEGSGCLDAGRVCMDDAAAPVGAVSLQLESADALFAPGGFVANPPPVQYPELGPWSAVQGLTVSREVLGLEPSALQLLAEHYRRMVDALNDQESRLLERAFLPPSLRRPEPGADCG